MRQETWDQVHELLKDFAKSSIKQIEIDWKRAYPFHQLFFDEADFVAIRRERSIVTRMGTKLYPQLARLIALDAHSDVEIEKEIYGTLHKATLNAIDRIVRDLRSSQKKSSRRQSNEEKRKPSRRRRKVEQKPKRRVPDHQAEVLEVLNARNLTLTSNLEREEVNIIADLMVGNLNNSPCFFEIKTPLPNLDICAQSKSKILTFIALLEGKDPRGYLAFPYNPFGSRSAYKHSVTKRIMDLDNEVLMGEEFWDLIGGQGTFDRLLQEIESVGDEIRGESD